jgi:hypothetical protein
METTVEKMYVDIPKSDLVFFKELVRKMGGVADSRIFFLDRYIQSRPVNAELTDGEIMDEVRAVRYGKV